MYISFIGMPSAGKTSVGRKVAEMLSFPLYDLDSMVEEKEGVSLISILETKSGEHFLNIQNEFLQNLNPQGNGVISPCR